VCWIRRREQLPVSSRLIRILLGRYLAENPLVTCQTALAGISGLFLAGSPSDRRRTLSRFSTELRSVLDEAGGSFLILPFLHPNIASDPAWGAGFISVAMPPNMVLDARWGSFDAFAASLRRSARKDDRRHRNRAIRLGLRSRLETTPPDIETVRRLVRAQERKHRSARLPFLDDLVRERPVPGGRWILVDRTERGPVGTAGETVGCGFIARDRRWLNLTALGLADNAPNVYFELMYGAIAHAIETRAAGIVGGGGAYDFKERLGYRRTPNNRVLFFSRSPRLRRLGAWLARQESLDPPGAISLAGTRI
jgi:predicted N-acyltransferase